MSTTHWGEGIKVTLLLLFFVSQSVIDVARRAVPHSVHCQQEQPCGWGLGHQWRGAEGQSQVRVRSHRC